MEGTNEFILKCGKALQAESSSPDLRKAQASLFYFSKDCSQLGVKGSPPTVPGIKARTPDCLACAPNL